MQCYTELLPPSGVTHSLSTSFTSSTAQNLVVVKTSLLQIYDFKTFDESESARLVLVAEYALQGTISTLGKVRLTKSKSGGDALLISFRDAKLSLIEWDPNRYSISTISIHYYENHDLLLCPWSPTTRDCVTRLTIDPSSRCAAFNFNTSSLAIIPFYQEVDDLAMDKDLDTSDDEQPQNGSLKDADDDMEHERKLSFPSFVLPMAALDPNLHHPVAMAFLHEYREPTLGVLYSTLAASMNMEPERRDVLAYAVYTLDPEQKASTTLLSVQKLPNDLHQVLAVPGPVGGTLLIGGNEIVHVDQGGRCNAVGVNEFSKQFTSLQMADQSDLDIRLESCRVEHLNNAANEMLLVLNDGRLAVLCIRMDGRSVSGLSFRVIDDVTPVDILQARCSTVASLPQAHIFLGSEVADSVLISTTPNGTQLKRVSSRAYLDDTKGDLDLQEDDDDDEDEDDIYANSKTTTNAQIGAMVGSNIQLMDKISCLAPVQDIILGRSSKRKREVDEADVDQSGLDSERVELVASCNQGAHGSLAFLSRAVTPKIIKKHKRLRTDGVWAMSSELSDLDPDARPFDDLLVITDDAESGEKRSSVLSISSTIAEKEASDFEQGDQVIATGRLATGSHVVVYSRDVRAYNQDFGLDQIFAIVDEDAEATAKVVTASVTDTHILLLKDDRSLTLLRTDKSGDLDEVELPDTVPSEDILSACLYKDDSDFFNSRRFNATFGAQKPPLLAILTIDGAFSIHPAANPAIELCQYTGLNFLPTTLSTESPIPKHWRSKDDLLEMCLCNLGSLFCSKPYLLVKTKYGDVTVYEPYSRPDVQGSYQFTKVCCHNGDPCDAPEDDEEDDSEMQLKPSSILAMHDVGGMGVAFVKGKHPLLIMKTNASLPHVHRLDIDFIGHISPFHDSSCNCGFVFTDAGGNLNFCELPTELLLDYSGWSIKRVEIGEEVSKVTYHPRTGAYVIATSTSSPFNLPRDDEWHPEWEENHEKSSSEFLPTTRSFSLKLISSSTHSIINQHRFEADEQVLSVKCMSLEVSEQTHERKDLIVVGTGFARGENVVARGYLYLFDIVDVVPYSDIPETDLKIKLIAREDVRGAVTAISSIGTQGFVLAAQGQKCMVRGLREDAAVLPVAFMDMRYYVSVAKELPGSGLAILADAFSGLWLLGYSEEPYKMQLIARDLENPSVVAAEFIPQEKQLYVVSSDDSGELRILQYDPWNPKSERGSILMQRSTFNTGYFTSLMMLLPRSPTPAEAVQVSSSTIKSDSDSENDMDVETPTLQNGHQILTATKEGAMGIITPLSEQSYRRLSTMQTVLTTQLEQYCGLNPRAHRAVETDGVGGRPMVDGEVVKRWLQQSSQHKFGLADRVGGTVWDVRADLEVIGGDGLGYL